MKLIQNYISNYLHPSFPNRGTKAKESNSIAVVCVLANHFLRRLCTYKPLTKSAFGGKLFLDHRLFGQKGME